jgi:hypothetical protein
MTSAFVTSRNAAESSAGSEYSPNLGAAGTGQRVTRVEARAAFLFRAHPERWQVLGGRVLPALGRLPLVPGVNAVELDERTGALRVQTAKAEAAERGWTVIPTSCVPPSSGLSSYLYRPTGRPDVTICAWEKCFPGSASTAPDEDGWIEFLTFLVDDGHVEECPMYVLDRMRSDALSRLDRAIDKSARNPSAASAVERIKAEVEVIEGEIARRTGDIVPSGGDAVDLDGDEPAPAPKRTRRPRSAK